MKTTLTPEASAASREALRRANVAFTHAYPGESSRRQPVHTVYGGAHLFRADTARKMGDLALAALRDYAADGSRSSPTALGLPQRGGFAQRVHDRVVDKLAARAGRGLPHRLRGRLRPPRPTPRRTRTPSPPRTRGGAGAWREGTLPPFIGIRIKSVHRRALRRAPRARWTCSSPRCWSDPAAGCRRPSSSPCPRSPSPEQVTAPGRSCCRSWSRPRPARRRAAAGADGGDAPGPLRRATAARRCRSLVAGRRGPLRRRALRRLRLHRRPATSRAHTSACTTPRATSRDTDAGGLAGTRRAACPTAPPTSCPWARTAEGDAAAPRRSSGARTATPCTARGSWRTGTRAHSLRARLLPGLGPAPRAAPRALRRRLRVLPRGPGRQRPQRLKAFVDKAAQATLLGDVFDDAATGQGLLNFFLRGARLRRHHGGGGPRHRPLAGGAAQPLLPRHRAGPRVTLRRAAPWGAPRSGAPATRARRPRPPRGCPAGTATAPASTPGPSAPRR